VTPLPEQNGHGTRVASLIAGALNQVGMAGVAPGATILPVAALDPSGVGDSSTVARAIIAAADAGARVINLSLGGPGRDPVLDQACRYAFTKGAVLVAAAGNSYQSGNQVQYPAASPNVLAVASVDGAGNPQRSPTPGPMDRGSIGTGTPAASLDAVGGPIHVWMGPPRRVLRFSCCLDHGPLRWVSSQVRGRYCAQMS
jgi:subtilisin family serine protease